MVDITISSNSFESGMSTVKKLEWLGFRFMGYDKSTPVFSAFGTMNSETGLEALLNNLRIKEDNMTTPKKILDAQAALADTLGTKIRVSESSRVTAIHYQTLIRECEGDTAKILSVVSKFLAAAQKQVDAEPRVKKISKKKTTKKTAKKVSKKKTVKKARSAKKKKS